MLGITGINDRSCNLESTMIFKLVVLTGEEIHLISSYYCFVFLGENFYYKPVFNLENNGCVLARFLCSFFPITLLRPKESHVFNRFALKCTRNVQQIYTMRNCGAS